MDSLFHFIFAFIGGMAVGLHRKHKLHILAFLSFSAVLIDVDHFIKYGIFHNIFITVILPFILFLISYKFERKKPSIKFQSYSLILMVMLTGHLLADLFYGDFVRPFYPLNDFTIRLEKSYLNIFNGTVISGDGISIAIYSLVILSARFVENFIYWFERKHESLRIAFKRGVIDEI